MTEGMIARQQLLTKFLKEKANNGCPRLLTKTGQAEITHEFGDLRPLDVEDDRELTNLFIFQCFFPSHICLECPAREETITSEEAI